EHLCRGGRPKAAARSRCATPEGPGEGTEASHQFPDADLWKTSACTRTKLKNFIQRRPRLARAQVPRRIVRCMRFVEVHGNRLSSIGLGTWQFGSKDWGYGAQYADVEAARIVERALDLGVNVIDTAEIYGRGNSERIVGKALRERRKEAFLATKVL